MITSPFMVNLLLILGSAWVLGLFFARFGLVVATVVIGLSNQLLKQQVIAQPLLTEGQFSALILMAFVTMLFAPLSLRWSVLRTCLPDEKADFCRLWEKN